MITKQLLSSLFLLTILLVNVQRGVSLKCYICSSDDEKSDCWNDPSKLNGTECVESEPTESPVTTGAPGVTTGAPAVTTGAPGVTTGAPAVTTGAPAVTTGAPAVTTEAPAVTTGAPAVTTGAPAVTTGAPAVTTRAPAPATGTPAPAPKSALVPQSVPEAPSLKETLSSEILNLIDKLIRDANQTKEVIPALNRAKRDTVEWQCAKIITKNDNQKKVLERKCVKKAEDVCKNKKNDADNKCLVCNDKELCNSASSIKLQLIPAFLSVLLALFFSSQ